jgi:hypothetical protein
MTCWINAGDCEKSSGAALSSSLDQGRQYAERTRRLGQGHMFGCRAVLILTALLILLMPLTEHLYAWDKFLQGGADVEFGSLCLLLFAGLVLVMAHRAANSPFLGLLAHRLIAFALPPELISGLAPSSVLCKIRAGQGTSPPLLSHSGTPLRI